MENKKGKVRSVAFRHYHSILIVRTKHNTPKHTHTHIKRYLIKESKQVKGYVRLAAQTLSSNELHITKKKKETEQLQ